MQSGGQEARRSPLEISSSSFSDRSSSIMSIAARIATFQLTRSVGAIESFADRDRSGSCIMAIIAEGVFGGSTGAACFMNCP